MANLSLEIVTPQSKTYSGDVKSVTLPGALSPFQVLINHAPIVSSLVSGVLKVEQLDGSVKTFHTSSGFAELTNNKLSVVVEKAEIV